MKFHLNCFLFVCTIAALVAEVVFVPPARWLVFLTFAVLLGCSHEWWRELIAQWNEQRRASRPMPWWCEFDERTRLQSLCIDESEYRALCESEGVVR